MQSSHKGCSPDNRTDVPYQRDALQVLIYINGKRVMQKQQKHLEVSILCKDNNNIEETASPDNW